MKLNRLSFYILFISLGMIACKGDGTDQNGVASDNQEQSSHDHSGHDHSGHDHNHDHSGHSHDDAQVNETKPYPRKSAAKNQTRTGGDASNVSSSSTNDPDETVSSEEWASKKNELDRAALQPDPSQIGHPVTKTNLPSPCGLINPEALARILKVDKGQITLKDGSGRASPHSQSCFFRWTHDDVPNSGVLIQVQDNPLPDEFPEWASYYIAAKIHPGEQMPDGSGAYKYTKLENGLGDAAAYSYDLGRYVWRLNKEYVFMIAFNLPGSGEQKIKWAESIGKEIMRNF